MPHKFCLTMHVKNQLKCLYLEDCINKFKKNNLRVSINKFILKITFILLLLVIQSIANA